jgi:hypothetical protein
MKRGNRFRGRSKSTGMPDPGPMTRRGRAPVTVGAVLLVLAAFGATRAEAADGTIVPASPHAQVVPNSYIAVLKDTADVRTRGVATVAAEQAAAAGITLSTVYEPIRGFRVTGAEAAARVLAGSDAVAWVQHNQRTPGHGISGTPLTLDPSGLTPVVTSPEQGTQTDPHGALDRIDQRGLPFSKTYSWTTTASTVTAYSLSTGINITHTAFEGRASFGFDFVDNQTEASDCFGNGSGFAGGTGVASLITSKKYGVSKGARVVAVRISDCSQSTTTDRLVAGLSWVIAHANRPAVVHLADSMPGDPAVDAAAQAVLDAGLPLVAHGGLTLSNVDNDDACGNSPGRVPGVITVTDTEFRSGLGLALASGTSIGPCVDIAAPNGSITAFGTGSEEPINDLTDFQSSGMVAGAVTLLVAQHPQWTPAQVHAALIANATTGVLTNAGTFTPNRFLYTGP